MAVTLKRDAQRRGYTPPIHGAEDGTDDLDVIVRLTRPGVIRKLTYTKPGTSGFQVNRVTNQGTSTNLLTVGTGENVTSGTELAGEPIPATEFGYLEIKTTGGVSGDKTFTLEIEARGNG